MKPKSGGFTLIELLVVISIIGLLSSIVLVSLNSARAKARDTKRRADLKQLQTALEFYYDTNNSYPQTPVQGGWGAGWGNCPGGNNHGLTGAEGYIPNLAPTYMAQLPTDPKPNNGPAGCYTYFSINSQEYKLWSGYTVETVCPVPSTDAMWDPPRDGYCIFAIYTPGAVNW